jgi:peptidoglycan/xylan/chitin deacetylase (PgdA/CDA1 family)
MSNFIFIRNDDVWSLERPFRDFFDFMLQQKIPVIYGVIPAKLTEEAAVFLRLAKENNPDLLDIVQHGYAHHNYAPDGERPYEFGPERTYTQQLDDITQGMKIMRRWFGEFLTPGFIPPYHAYDAHTIEVIETLGIPLHSARLKVPRQEKKFLDLPAQIWANRADEHGIPSPMDFHALARDLASVMGVGPITGVVFRHHMMVGQRDQDVLKALMRLVVQERTKGNIQTVLFSELLDATHKS